VSTLRIQVNKKDLNPGQLKFLMSRQKFLLLSGGYGSGKTTILAWKILTLIAANPGVPGLVVAANWRVMKAVTWPAIQRMFRTFLPRSRMPRVVDWQGEAYFDFEGTRVYLRSAKNVDGFEGLDVGWVAGDELRYWSSQAYNVAVGRARVRCPFPQRAFVSTPQMNWMADEFNTGKERHALITAPTLENLHNLDPDYVNDLKLAYSPRLQKAILEGIFTVLEGAVYEAFDPQPTSRWFVDYDPKAHRNESTYLAIDPGFRRSSFLWVRRLPNMKWVVFRELHPENCSMIEAAHRVNDINQREGIAIDQIWCDPAADSREQATGVKVMQALSLIKRRTKRSNISYVAGAFTGISYGVERVRALIGDPDNGQHIRLLFARHLAEASSYRGIVRSLTAYSYPEVKDGRPVSDIPAKDGTFDHAVDALRYLIVGLWLSDPNLWRLDHDAQTRALLDEQQRSIVNAA